MIVAALKQTEHASEHRNKGRMNTEIILSVWVCTYPRCSHAHQDVQCIRDAPATPNTGISIGKKPKPVIHNHIVYGQLEAKVCGNSSHERN